jgi:hypothetical protein
MLGLAVTCALLTLAVAVPLRAIQIDELITRQLKQVPACPCVIILDPSFLFYAGDLVQNDPSCATAPCG